jgi:hypothetical protein
MQCAAHVLLAANNTPRLSPAQALEKEMQEMDFNNPNCSATACVTVDYSSRTGKPGTSPGIKQGYSSPTYSAGQAAGLSGRPGSPGGAVLAAQPFVAQHNNLMGGGGGSSSSATGRASPGGMTKLRERL